MKSIWVIVIACVLTYSAILVRASQLVYVDEPGTKSRFYLSYDPAPVLSGFGWRCSWTDGGGGAAQWRAVSYGRDGSSNVQIDLERADDLIPALLIDVERALGNSGAQIKARAAGGGRYTLEYESGKTRGEFVLGPVGVAGPGQTCEKSPTVIVEFRIRETWSK